MGEIAEEDKVDRFRGLELHTKVPGVEGAWTSKVAGDTQTYNKGEGTITFAYNVLRSLRWPGAVTVAKGGKFVNIYIGGGNDTATSKYIQGKGQIKRERYSTKISRQVSEQNRAL